MNFLVIHFERTKEQDCLEGDGRGKEVWDPDSDGAHKNFVPKIL